MNQLLELFETIFGSSSDDAAESTGDPRASRLRGYDHGEPKIKHAAVHGETYRGPFERDLDRLKYTPFFRRLKNVTQVARAEEAYLYHDRLTHSLKVAQVGRRLAELLIRRRAEETIANQAQPNGSDAAEGLPEENPDRSLVLAEVAAQFVDEDIRRELNPDAIESACLAHDIGHPPFGHIAEEELDQILLEYTHPAVNEDIEWEGVDSGVDWTLDDLSDPDDEELDGWSVERIDAWLRAYGEDPPGLRFEGNAQSFRILTRLANHDGSHTGLGLTLGTLIATQKYPYGRGEWCVRENGFSGLDDAKVASGARETRTEGKFGCYETEYDAFQKVREGLDLGSDATLAADVMDYADDLTYAVHDLTDFYKYDQIPLHRLLRQAHPGYSYDDPAALDTLKDEIDPLEEGPDVTDTMQFLASEASSVDPSGSLFRPYDAKRQQEEALRAFTSGLIEFFIDAKEGVDDQLAIEQRGGQYRLIDKHGRFRGHIHILQKLTEYYVITDTALAGQQRGQRRLLRELFEELYDEVENNELEKSAVPSRFIDWFEDEDISGGRAPQARIVADIIAAMTERQIIKLHGRLTGQAPGSLEDYIIG